MNPWIVCQQLVKIYKQGDLEVIALQGLDLTVTAGEMLALIGTSGSGKSTLLAILGGILQPSAGRVTVGQRDLLLLDNQQRQQYRQQEMGFIWQNPSQNLLPYLTIADNVAWPMVGQRQASRVAHLLDLVDLTSMAQHKPAALSGGQQQRAALAVALANDPALLLADEPTGQLDKAGAASLLDVMRHARDQLGTTIVMVTHDPLIASIMDRVVTIRDGRTSSEWHPTAIATTDTKTQATETQDTWILVDGAGRLQMPAAYVAALGIQHRVKLSAADDLTIWPAPKTAAPKAATPTNAPDWAALLGPRLPHRPHPAVTLDGVSRQFGAGPTAVTALDTISLNIQPATFTVISGHSGSGKSSLLNLIGGLDLPTAGTLRVLGNDLSQWSENDRALWRREKVHYLFQNFGLMPFLTAAENVALPLRLLGIPRRERQQQVAGLLAAVGLSGRAQHRAETLSGGEQQRVALARALAGRPDILLADEPTGQLDTLTGAEIVALLRRVVDDLGLTVIVASHDPQLITAGDTIHHLSDGHLQPDL